jgi:hypothetical protein
VSNALDVDITFVSYNTYTGFAVSAPPAPPAAWALALLLLILLPVKTGVYVYSCFWLVCPGPSVPGSVYGPYRYDIGAAVASVLRIWPGLRLHPSPHRACSGVGDGVSWGPLKLNALVQVRSARKGSYNVTFAVPTIC